MMFKKDTPVYSYEVRSEAGENVMYINYMGAAEVPTLSSPNVMARTLDALKEEAEVSRIVFVQQRNYSYDFKQVQILNEINDIYEQLIKEEQILSTNKLNILGKWMQDAYSVLNHILNEVLKQDPVKAYRELKGIYYEQKALEEKEQGSLLYVNLLKDVLDKLANLKIIKQLKQYFDSYKIGDREIYDEIFRADVMPNFTFTRMQGEIGKDAEIIRQYEIAKGHDKSLVTILKEKNKGKLFYHLSPPEYNLEEEHHMLLNLARNVLIEHQPSEDEFKDPERTRQVFFNVAKDLLRELASNKNVNLQYQELNKLATILVRHTIGFGILEVLLQDDNLQDIVVNAPVSQSSIFVRHNEFDECSTNIIPSQEDADSWAAKFRMLSGRALNEANPILDTSLQLAEIGARIAIVQEPLSSGGIAYAIRRHRSKPWTLPLFIQNKMISPLAAGLMSFLVDGARTLLVAGTRSSGKTSLLGALMLEILPKYRIITLEDTLELPVSSLRKLDYDILSMKVRSALVGESTEVAAEEGIRASLRLGDSSLIVGEIRSEEAKALYEAMRVGALANVVAGTIHGSSPYAVFDRVVNDLGVPITSFKATDCVIVANPIKSADGLHSFKRVLQIAEVRKHWEKDPLAEGGFVDLMNYDIEHDRLEPSQDLINGDSQIIKDIAAQVKGWAGNWDAVWDNIQLRARIKEEIVKVAEKTGKQVLLEAPFTVKSNNAFHQISERVRQEEGLPVSDKVFLEWKNWLNSEIDKLA
ncbi:MAG: ATPase, T2SS/T4P/T4SS family [Candidatus Nanoarchaeia archaeon]